MLGWTISALRLPERPLRQMLLTSCIDLVVVGRACNTADHEGVRGGIRDSVMHRCVAVQIRIFGTLEAQVWDDKSWASLNGI